MKSGIKKGFREILLAAVIMLIVGMMIIPLSPWLMDLLISFNLAISMLIFALALFQKNPLKFSAFPTVLLLATLYRLALNISSTRLILTRADAGQIIGGFGGFIVGGDIIVGAVIFGVILMVLFLVITKGAERVAEVAARFTLDALPGMQLAIETDLRSKTISPRELSRRREELESRSMYYGSLDGAMKFVRGDAVAALVITVINVAGGTLIGVLRKDMALMDSLNLYGRLTVGDGLVTMIPALLISTAAGLLVTRVAQGHADEGLASQIGSELFSVPQAMVAAAAMMILLSIAPGLPAWPFLIAATALVASVLTGRLQARKQSGKGPARNTSLSSASSISLDEMQQLLDNASEQYPVLVREAVWNRISLPFLADIVAELRDDGIDERQLPTVLEALARETVVDDVDDMLMRIRKRLAPLISQTVAADASPLPVATMDMETEQMLQNSIVSTAGGKRMVLDPAFLSELLDALEPLRHADGDGILMVGAALRRPLQRLLRESRCGIRVIGHGELVASLAIDIRMELSL